MESTKYLFNYSEHIILNVTLKKNNKRLILLAILNVEILFMHIKSPKYPDTSEHNADLTYFFQYNCFLNFQFFKSSKKNEIKKLALFFYLIYEYFYKKNFFHNNLNQTLNVYNYM